MLFTEVMERLEQEARALRDGKGSRMNWRILTVLYCIKVGSYENLCSLLLDLSERMRRGEVYSPGLMRELSRELRAFISGLGEEGKRLLREERFRIVEGVKTYGHWWWRELLSAIT